MSIEMLSDSCLLRIFGEINDKKTLIICSQVNRKWYSLIFPDTTPLNRYNSGKVEGYVQSLYHTFMLDEWEIVASCYETNTEYLIEHGRKIKQLYIPNMEFDEFLKYVKYLPRLERLHLSSECDLERRYKPSNGPELERLEILEIRAEAFDAGPHRGLSLMDRCPNLKSVFHCIGGGDFFIDTQVTNNYIEDLVIKKMDDNTITWQTLRKILKKCPNIKHLAIRHKFDTELEDEDIPEMLQLLPKVVLIDLRNSPGVTNLSANYVEEYCKLHNRSISFYYTYEHAKDILSDWPYLSSKYARSCHGYNFMVHCFLKTFQ